MANNIVLRLPVLTSTQSWCCDNGCGNCTPFLGDEGWVSDCCKTDLLLWDESQESFVDIVEPPNPRFVDAAAWTARWEPAPAKLKRLPVGEEWFYWLMLPNEQNAMLVRISHPYQDYRWVQTFSGYIENLDALSRFKEALWFGPVTVTAPPPWPHD